MGVYVSSEFVTEVQAILKSNAHADCEKGIIDSIFTKSIDEIKNSGCKRLGGDPNKSPFLRKRIETTHAGKSSGYRLYFWLLVSEGNVYLLFIHPKTGRKSGSNLTVEKQKELVATFTNCRKDGTFLSVELDTKIYKIVYSAKKKEDRQNVF